MELATSRMLGMSNWLSTNKYVKISLAIALPSLALLLSTTPITNKLAQAWRRATGQTSSKKETTRPERSEHDTNDTPPGLPKKSYGQLPSGKRVARPERSERGTNDKRPEMPEKSHGQPSFGKRATRSERSEHGMKNDNIVYKNNSSGNIPASPKKSYAAAAAATPAAPSAEPFSPLTPDSASIASESSSEHSQKHKFRLGKNIKKRWQIGKNIKKRWQNGSWPWIFRVSSVAIRVTRGEGFMRRRNVFLKLFCFWSLFTRSRSAVLGMYIHGHR